MLDLITIFSAVGLQQELGAEGRTKDLVIRPEDSSEGSFVEEAAGQLAAVFDRLDTALAQGVSAILGDGSEKEPAMPEKTL